MTVTESIANGRVYHLAHGDFAAEITEVGGALRRFAHGDRDLVLTYDPDEMRVVSSGTILAPWPNRITGGRYSFQGRDYQLALTEPGSSSAIHGLVLWVRWSEVEVAADRVVLVHDLVPQHGYPFALRLTAEYRLDDDGLHSTVTASNVGRTTAPYGFGAHPYVVAGPGPVDEWTVTLDASSYLHFATKPVADESMRSVNGHPFDFRGGAIIGETRLNHPYTDLGTDDDGRTGVTVTAPDGRGVRVTWDATGCPWVQLFTTDFPQQPFNRGALAVEPMSCPPNVFGNGIDLVTLNPGDEHRAQYSISPVG